MPGTLEYHIHTSASWCAASAMTIPAIAELAASRGAVVIGLADHVWLTTPRPGRPLNAARPSVGRILALRPLLAALSHHVPHILLGAEADAAPGMGIAGGAELAGLDYVIGAYHFSGMRAGLTSWPQTPEELARAMLDGFQEIVASPHVRIIGHPFFIPPRVYRGLAVSLREGLAQTFQDIAKGVPPLLEAARRAGIAIELNAKALGPLHQPELLPIYRMAREIGCRFVLSSDAHRLEDIGHSVTLLKYAKSAGIEAPDFIEIQPRSGRPAEPGWPVQTARRG